MTRLSVRQMLNGVGATPVPFRAAIKKVSARLGNTPTICRKCYVHPEVLNCYLDGNLVKSKAESELRSGLESLKPEEASVLALLRFRLTKEAEGFHKGAPPDADVQRSYSPSFENAWRCP